MAPPLKGNFFFKRLNKQSTYYRIPGRSKMKAVAPGVFPLYPCADRPAAAHDVEKIPAWNRGRVAIFNQGVMAGNDPVGVIVNRA